jgi:hypothetical protein
MLVWDDRARSFDLICHAEVIGDELWIQFIDNGTGFSEDDLKYAGKRWFPTKKREQFHDSENEGTWLWGTSTWLREYGARLDIANRKDKRGAVISIVVPLNLTFSLIAQSAHIRPGYTVEEVVEEVTALLNTEVINQFDKRKAQRGDPDGGFDWFHKGTQALWIEELKHYCDYLSSLEKNLELHLFRTKIHRDLIFDKVKIVPLKTAYSSSVIVHGSLYHLIATNDPVNIAVSYIYKRTEGTLEKKFQAVNDFLEFKRIQLGYPIQIEQFKDIKLAADPDVNNNDIKIDFAQAGVADNAKHRKGGIDFAQSNLDMQIKRDGNGVVLPLNQQNLENIHIQGLVPVILKIEPASMAQFFR